MFTKETTADPSGWTKSPCWVLPVSLTGWPSTNQDTCGSGDPVAMHRSDHLSPCFRTEALNVSDRTGDTSEHKSIISANLIVEYWTTTIRFPLLFYPLLSTAFRLLFQLSSLSIRFQMIYSCPIDGNHNEWNLFEALFSYQEKYPWNFIQSHSWFILMRRKYSHITSNV